MTTFKYTPKQLICQLKFHKYFKLIPCIKYFKKKNSICHQNPLQISLELNYKYSLINKIKKLESKQAIQFNKTLHFIK